MKFLYMYVRVNYNVDTARDSGNIHNHLMRKWAIIRSYVCIINNFKFVTFLNPIIMPTGLRHLAIYVIPLKFMTRDIHQFIFRIVNWFS